MKFTNLATEHSLVPAFQGKKLSQLMTTLGYLHFYNSTHSLVQPDRLTYSKRDYGGPNVHDGGHLGHLLGGQAEGFLDGGQGLGGPGHHGTQAEGTQAGCTQGNDNTSPEP